MSEKNLVDSTLTLFNEYGEKYSAGKMSTYVKTGSKLRMRWEALGPMKNVSPFTMAMLHSGIKILRVSNIRAFEPGIDAKEIELEFAL